MHCEALENPTPDTLSRIFQNKRALAILRRVLVNTRDVTGHLQRTESPYIARDMWPFLRDVYDHVARNLDLVEMMRDLLSGALDVYLSSVANRTNQVMKVLTVLSTIALPRVVKIFERTETVGDVPTRRTAVGKRYASNMERRTLCYFRFENAFPCQNTSLGG